MEIVVSMSGYDWFLLFALLLVLVLIFSTTLLILIVRMRFQIRALKRIEASNATGDFSAVAVAHRERLLRTRKISLGLGIFLSVLAFTLLLVFGIAVLSLSS